MMNLPIYESLDGNFIKYSGEVVYQCPRCLRTATHPNPSCYTINTWCKCEYPHVVHEMQCLGLRAPIGYREVKMPAVFRYRRRLAQ